MKKLPILLCAAFFCCTSALAANTGDVIGDIYSTDIIADVDGAPIRSFSLNGKTAIIVEDLCRYGFEVGYNDDLRALYACVRDNTYTAYPDEVERGKCGEIVGHIYQSDITTSINGIDVPCFSLNGEMAAAIEDIAADITQSDRSDTGMMYRWNAENRTITLLPDYDNGVQARIVFNQYGAAPYIENGVLKYQPGLRTSEIAADIPDGAFKYPIRWADSTGEIVGYAYDSKRNEPIQFENGIWEMTSKRRIITHFDIDALYRLSAAENIEPQSYESVLKTETERLSSEGRVPEIYTSENGAILQSGTYITIIQKGENGACAMRCEDFSPCQMTAERPQMSEYALESTKRTDEPTSGCIFTYKTAGGRYYEVFAAFDGYFENREAVPRETALGTMYSLTSCPPGKSGMFECSINVTVDGESHALPGIQTMSAMAGPWTPAKALSELLGGGAAVSDDGFTLALTTDGKPHDLSFSTELIQTPPMVLDKTVCANIPETSSALYGIHGNLTEDGKDIVQQVTRTVSTAGMSNREITVTLPSFIYDGEVYVPIELIQNLYK